MTPERNNLIEYSVPRSRPPGVLAWVTMYQTQTPPHCRCHCPDRCPGRPGRPGPDRCPGRPPVLLRLRALHHQQQCCRCPDLGAAVAAAGSFPRLDLSPLRPLSQCATPLFQAWIKQITNRKMVLNFVCIMIILIIRLFITKKIVTVMRGSHGDAHASLWRSCFSPITPFFCHFDGQAICHTGVHVLGLGEKTAKQMRAQVHRHTNIHECDKQGVIKPIQQWESPPTKPQKEHHFVQHTSKCLNFSLVTSLHLKHAMLHQPFGCAVK